MDEAKISNEDINKLIQENLDLTKEVLSLTKKIKRHSSIQQFFSWIYFIFIVLPIVLAIVFLPGILAKYWVDFKGVLGGDTGALSEILRLPSVSTGNPASKIDINQEIKKLSPDTQKILQDKGLIK